MARILGLRRSDRNEIAVDCAVCDHDLTIDEYTGPSGFWETKGWCFVLHLFMLLALLIPPRFECLIDEPDGVAVWMDRGMDREMRNLLHMVKVRASSCGKLPSFDVLHSCSS